MSRSYHHGRRNKKKLYGDNWRWSRQEPKAWRRAMKHKKRRSKVQQCRYEVMRGNTEVLWPLDKKPWIYYW